ncbi:MAG: acyl transferase [Bacteroidetes bacterium]|nr:acyl transferase [Bacteroidota bacterium]
MSITKLVSQIFDGTETEFEEFALQIFHEQYKHVDIYRSYIDMIGKDVNQIHSIIDIPFLPIQFFKSHKVISNRHQNAHDEFICFESSGTTSEMKSRHIIQDISLYQTSFEKGFQHFFAAPNEYCILALLPSYLERSSSSLVYMMAHLIEASQNPLSGFYLYEHEKLHKVISELEGKKQATLLFGVTYALLDYAEKFPQQLQYTKIVETGGMKGRRVELSREEVHYALKQAFALTQVYSEYGMTELLSQAYSLGDGIFRTPAWMKVLVRDEYDPFHVQKEGKGVLNIIDLANVNSCSFIASEDIGVVHKDASFEVKGRLDQADLRGCSLMLV